MSPHAFQCLLDGDRRAALEEIEKLKKGDTAAIAKSLTPAEKARRAKMAAEVSRQLANTTRQIAKLKHAVKVVATQMVGPTAISDSLLGCVRVACAGGYAVRYAAQGNSISRGRAELDQLRAIVQTLPQITSLRFIPHFRDNLDEADRLLHEVLTDGTPLLANAKNSNPGKPHIQDTIKGVAQGILAWRWSQANTIYGFDASQITPAQWAILTTTDSTATGGAATPWVKLSRQAINCVEGLEIHKDPGSQTDISRDLSKAKAALRNAKPWVQASAVNAAASPQVGASSSSQQPSNSQCTARVIQISQRRKPTP